MSFSFIAYTDLNGTNGGTSASTDMTGADTFVVVLITADVETVSDSEANTYTLVKSQGTIRIYVARNATSSNSMTFTVSGTNIFTAAIFLGYSGGKLSSPIEDQTNGANYSGQTSNQPGSVLPTQDDELIVCTVATDADPGGSFTINIDSSFTPDPMLVKDLFGGGCFVAYKIQMSAGAENPTMSWTNSVSGSSAIASFFSEPVEPPEDVVLMGDGLT
jgi:hypothetical protein